METRARTQLEIMAYNERKLTGSSIQTWALEEARRRLEAEGILAEPVTKN